MNIQSNNFIGCQANYNGNVASTGSGGVFYMKVESLDLIIKGGIYSHSRAYYGAIIYIETFANQSSHISNLEISENI